MKKILLLGATGQVGNELLSLALESQFVSKVVAPTRRHLPEHPKLENPIVDFDKLPLNAPWWQVDVVLCALGTTLRQAESRDGFYRVDHDYVVTAARLARQAGTQVFGLVSSLGADRSSRFFYLRSKGETERDIMALAFASFIVIRPSLLVGGPRAHGRPLEAAGLFIGKHLSSLMPRRYRAVSTKAVARNLIEACIYAQPGLKIIESEFIRD